MALSLTHWPSEVCSTILGGDNVQIFLCLCATGKPGKRVSGEGDGSKQALIQVIIVSPDVLAWLFPPTSAIMYRPVGRSHVARQPLRKPDAQSASLAPGIDAPMLRLQQARDKKRQGGRTTLDPLGVGDQGGESSRKSAPHRKKWPSL